MKIELAILKPFFARPRKGYFIRELAKEIGINPMSVRRVLLEYTTEGIISKKAAKPYDVFLANIESRKYLNLKIYYNLELLRESHVIEYLEKTYDYPPIVLFGSFAKGYDDEMSDIDICIVSDVKRQINLEAYERIIGKKISLHHFTHKEWINAKKKNPNLVNNIINGITLSGQLEVV